MADLLKEVEKGVLAFVLVEAEANRPAIIAWIGSGESRVNAALKDLIAHIPAVRGLLGSVANPLLAAVEAGIEGYVAQLLAKESPEVVYGYLVSLLTRLQAEV
jgi:hypothetical protein